MMARHLHQTGRRSRPNDLLRVLLGRDVPATPQLKRAKVTDTLSTKPPEVGTMVPESPAESVTAGVMVVVPPRRLGRGAGHGRAVVLEREAGSGAGRDVD